MFYNFWVPLWHHLPKHLILQCQTLLHIRNCMYYKIVDIFPLEESVQFLYHNDGNILESLLRGINNTIRSMESDLWESLMCHISEYMSTFYYNFKHVLQFNTFNVCQQVFYRATLYLKFDRFTCMYICSSCMSLFFVWSFILFC
jgi:hypothetical protein